MQKIVTLIFSFFCMSHAIAATFVENFNEGNNSGNWSFGRPLEWEVESSPISRFLKTTTLIEFIPTLSSSDKNHPFSGDFLNRKVSSISVTLKTFFVEYPQFEREISLSLCLPDDGERQWCAYTIHAHSAPKMGENWKDFMFPIFSQSTEIPANWNWILYSEGEKTAEPTWPELMKNVSQVKVHFGNPHMYYILQNWHLGADNLTIVDNE